MSQLVGAVIAMIPCVIIYVALQRYYVRGLVPGAVKGWVLRMCTAGGPPKDHTGRSGRPTVGLRRSAPDRCQ